MAEFSILDLTGEQYDEAELLMGKSVGEASLAHLSRAVGFIRRREIEPGLTYGEYTKRTVSEHIEDSGLSDKPLTDKGKA